MITSFQLKFTKNIIDTLPGIIPGGISAKDFSVIAKIDDKESEKILENFVKIAIGTKKENKYYSIHSCVDFYLYEPSKNC